MSGKIQDISANLMQRRRGKNYFPIKNNKPETETKAKLYTDQVTLMNKVYDYVKANGEEIKTTILIVAPSGWSSGVLRSNLRENLKMLKQFISDYHRITNAYNAIRKNDDLAAVSYDCVFDAKFQELFQMLGQFLKTGPYIPNANCGGSCHSIP